MYGASTGTSNDPQANWMYRPPHEDDHLQALILKYGTVPTLSGEGASPLQPAAQLA